MATARTSRRSTAPRSDRDRHGQREGAQHGQDLRDERGRTTRSSTRSTEPGDAEPSELPSRQHAAHALEAVDRLLLAARRSSSASTTSRATSSATPRISPTPRTRSSPRRRAPTTSRRRPSGRTSSSSPTERLQLRAHQEQGRRRLGASSTTKTGTSARRSAAAVNGGFVEVSAEVSRRLHALRPLDARDEIGDDTLLAATMGGIDESFGETAYTVKPFAYWTEQRRPGPRLRRRALDRPDGLPKTWWQLEYGARPDLTLNLPRLLDFEEQAGITSDAARFISPGVQGAPGHRARHPTAIEPAYPPSAGEPLCLAAQVENYSLKDAPRAQGRVLRRRPRPRRRLLGSDNVAEIRARDSRSQSSAGRPTHVRGHVPADLRQGRHRGCGARDPRGEQKGIPPDPGVEQHHGGTARPSEGGGRAPGRDGVTQRRVVRRTRARRSVFLEGVRLSG